MAKPIGAICNMKCHYCYYLKKQDLYPGLESFHMPERVLESYILQHIQASGAPVINFEWHGGEPTLLGLDYFRTIVSLQRKHKPPGQHITNGIQTNGTLLDDAWCRFLATERFSVGVSLDGPRELHDPYRVTKGGSRLTSKWCMAFDFCSNMGSGPISFARSIIGTFITPQPCIVSSRTLEPIIFNFFRRRTYGRHIRRRKP